MNLKEQMGKFNKRWSITPTDTYMESFSKFKTRILNILKDVDNHTTKEGVKLFCQYYGIKEVWHTQPYGDYSWSTNITERLNQESDEKEFYRLIELIFSLDITQTMDYSHCCIYSKNILFKKVKEAVELSDVNISIIASDGEIILYPKGEKMFDEELVDSPLSVLNKESAEHFVQALQFYQSKRYIKSAESLRRSLEEFLRNKLNNSKGLNSNIVELQTQLKSERRGAQVRNIIGSTFNYIDQYFNANSKHNDGNIDDAENEFLIYQVGLLLRYIEKSINLCPIKLSNGKRA